MSLTSCFFSVTISNIIFLFFLVTIGAYYTIPKCSDLKQQDFSLFILFFFFNHWFVVELDSVVCFLVFLSSLVCLDACSRMTSPRFVITCWLCLFLTSEEAWAFCGNPKGARKGWCYLYKDCWGTGLELSSGGSVTFSCSGKVSRSTWIQGLHKVWPSRWSSQIMLKSMSKICLERTKIHIPTCSWVELKHLLSERVPSCMNTKIHSLFLVSAHFCVQAHCTVLVWLIFDLYPYYQNIHGLDIFSSDVVVGKVMLL